MVHTYVMVFLSLLSACDMVPVEWGVSSSAYQFEGGACEGGRTWSIWDMFSHEKHGKNIRDHSNADVTTDVYNDIHIEHDIINLHSLGIQHYRLSFSWSRLFPNATGIMNESGRMYYQTVIDLLKKYNMTPWVTLFHWDTPLYYDGGWERPEMVAHFVDYGVQCIHTFPDVTNWVTINEIRTFVEQGYEHGIHAPGKKNRTLAHVVAKHMLLGHYELYQTVKSMIPYVSLGLAFNIDFFEPQTTSDFSTAYNLYLRQAWYVEVLLGGHVPFFVLDEFPFLEWPYTQTQTMDFFGLNYYSGYIVHNHKVTLVPHTRKTASKWLHPYPKGIVKFAHFLSQLYSNIVGELEIVVTETGVSTTCGHDDNDTEIRGRHFLDIKHTLENASHTSWPINKIFMWSHLDNFEWNAGYTECFGMWSVNFSDPQRKRCLKQSTFDIFPHAHLSYPTCHFSSE